MKKYRVCIKADGYVEKQKIKKKRRKLRLTGATWNLLVVYMKKKKDNSRKKKGED